jgi:preprotein translocase subunit SecE
VKERFARLKQFLVEVVAELKKTTWPARREVYGTTLVVIVAVLICATYLWIVDTVLNYGLRSVYKALGHD